MGLTTRPSAGDFTAIGAADVRGSVLERVLQRFRDVALRAGSAHGLAGDELDEVMQETRIRLWRAASGLPKLESLSPAYVYRAASSAALDLLRRRRARHESRLDDEPDAAAALPSREATDAALLSSEAVRAIEAAIEELHANRRAVVRMYLKGYSREEIAALLGWSEAKTRNLLYRGLDDLRAALLARGIRPEGVR